MVRTEQDGRVLTATLDNPLHNFLDRGLVLELDELTERWARDPTIGAVVLTSSHPSAFVTHYAVEEILAGALVTPDLPQGLLSGAISAIGALDRLPGTSRALLRTRLAGLVTLHRVHRLYLRMNRMDKVFVAAINGFTTAGGLELALACDVRLMADGDGRIGLTEPLLGLHPGGGGGHRLTRAVGPARSVEMLLEARLYTPREAVDVGLVHRVVEPARLLEEAQATAERLSRRSPRAIRSVKRAAYGGFSARWPTGLRIDRLGFVWSAVAPETRRAMQVFLDQLERLPPHVPSPWADPDHLRAWQAGTAADLVGVPPKAAEEVA